MYNHPDNPQNKQCREMMKRSFIYLMLISVVCLIFTGCRRRHYECTVDNGSEVMDNGEDRHNSDDYRTERSIRRGAKVKMESNGGVYLVPINVNGLDLKFIFDTGASNICISSAEAMVMVRQGKITEKDVLGQERFQDATGGISIGTVVNLNTVNIGGIVLHDVEATVVDNISAPLLLGQTALAKFGKISIDYNNLTIEFN